MSQLIIKYTPNFDNIVYTEVHMKKNDAPAPSSNASLLQQIIEKQKKEEQEKYKPSHLIAHF